jgi:O-antigen ligase
MARLEAYDQQRMLQLCCLIAGTTLMLAMPSTRRQAAELLRAMRIRDLSAISIAMILGALSAARAPFAQWALLEWALFVQLAGLLLTVAAVHAQAPEMVDKVLGYTIGFSCLAYATSLISAYTAMLLTDTSVRLDQLYPHFSNVSFPGQMITMAIPVLAWLAVSASKGSRVWITTGAVLIAFAIGYGTRGTWLALSVSTALLLVLSLWAGARSCFRAQASILVLGFVLYAAGMFALPRFLGIDTISGVRRALSIETLTDDSYRFELWRNAIEITAQSPWLGIGPGHFAAVDNPFGNHPHNSVLQLSSEWGLPATTLIIGCAVALLAYLVLHLTPRRTTPEQRPGDSAIHCALLAALTGAFVHSLVDGILVVPTSQVLLFLLAGWSAGSLSRGHAAAPNPSQMGRKYMGWWVIGLMTCLLVSVSILVVKATHQFRHIEELTESRQGHLPRFWVQGDIGPCSRPNCRVADQ